jgi:hypothetical protein
MGPINPDALLAFTFLLMFGGASLIGLRMFLNYRIKRFQAQGGAAPPRELEEGLAELREQMYLLRGEVTDIQERLDFTERVLTRGKDDEQRPAQV